MKEQLIQYVDLLFAGAPDAEEVKQEILQNTLDRYDDLISQGKSPEAAYRLAISGIGDIHEILGNPAPRPETSPNFTADVKTVIHEEAQDIQSRKLKAVAVAMYILCPIPLFILSEFGLDTMGLCFTLLLVAAATALIMMSRRNAPEEANREAPAKPESKLQKSVGSLIWAIGLAAYFIVSVASKAWFITWLIFPITASIKGLVNAILDLKEVNDHEA